MRPAGVHHAAQWRRSCVAAGCERAAREAADHWVLGSGHAFDDELAVAAFVQRLRELGWIESRTVAIEYRWAEGRNERYAEIAAEFTRLKVDVIVTSGTPAVIAAKQATAVIPIVFVTVTDPVGSGLVASLARPGGNVTGLSLQSPDIAGKRLALLREVVPDLRRVAFMGNVDNPVVPPEMREMQAAAGTLGSRPPRRNPADAGHRTRLRGTQAWRGGALSASEGRRDANRLRINILALGARLPTMWSQQELVEAGGLMSYGPSFPELYRRAADFVDKILRGASRPIFQSNSRPSSISSSIWSWRRRSELPCLQTLSLAPTTSDCNCKSSTPAPAAKSMRRLRRLSVRALMRSLSAPTPSSTRGV